MTLDNMTGITEGSYTGFCKSQLITCNFVKACNGVCPFEDALKHADKMQTMNEKHTVDHDRDWIIGCIKHDGFIKTDRFDKANQIILDALSAEAEWIPCSERLPECSDEVLTTYIVNGNRRKRYVETATYYDGDEGYWSSPWDEYRVAGTRITVLAWMPLPNPYREGGE